jgi:transposase
VRALAKKILPAWFVRWYRRRRVLRGYLRLLSEELLERQTRIDTDEVAGRLSAAGQGFYEGLVKDVLDRMDLILQELDRRIQGVATRHGQDLAHLRDEVAALRAAVEALPTSTTAIR